jgi:hypothetical protein
MMTINHWLIKSKSVKHTLKRIIMKHRQHYLTQNKHRRNDDKNDRQRETATTGSIDEINDVEKQQHHFLPVETSFKETTINQYLHH